MEQPCHILAKDIHALHSFRVLFGFAGGQAEDHVSVIARGHEHFGDGEILVDLFPRGDLAAAAHGDDGRSHLVAEKIAVGFGDIKRSVKKAFQGAADAGIVYRRAYQDAVRREKFLERGIENPSSKTHRRFLFSPQTLQPTQPCRALRPISMRSLSTSRSARTAQTLFSARVVLPSGFGLPFIAMIFTATPSWLRSYL